MATSTTMKLIMAVFVLMNFSGLVINLTSPRLMSNNESNNESNNDNNDFSKAPLSFPYNSTSNTQAKPSQAAVRPPMMKQRPQPNATAFFVEWSPLEIPLAQCTKKTSKKTTNFAAWRKAQAKRLLAAAKAKIAKLAADLAAAGQQSDALAADLLRALHERDALAAQVARVEEERAQLASLLDAVLHDAEASRIHPAQAMPAYDPMTRGQFFDPSCLPNNVKPVAEVLPQPEACTPIETTINMDEVLKKLPAALRNTADLTQGCMWWETTADDNTATLTPVAEVLPQPKARTHVETTIDVDEVLKKLPAALLNMTDLTQGFIWWGPTDDDTTAAPLTPVAEVLPQPEALTHVETLIDVDEVLAKLPAALRNATDLTQGRMWAETTTDTTALAPVAEVLPQPEALTHVETPIDVDEVLAKLPAALRNATDLTQGRVWSETTDDDLDIYHDLLDHVQARSPASLCNVTDLTRGRTWSRSSAELQKLVDDLSLPGHDSPWSWLDVAVKVAD